jgi:large subunit ribosomal protein L17
MRHRVAYRKLGRVTEHRIAMLRNMAASLLQHERIRTTVPKAKELRPFVERLITVAKRGLAASEDSTGGVTARRMVARDIADRDVVRKLFDTIAPRYVERPGGYTRILRVGVRRGDAAEMAEIELIGSEYDPRSADPDADSTEKPKTSVGGRLRKVLGGRKKADDEKARVDDRAKGSGRVTTPRRAGGS